MKELYMDDDDFCQVYGQCEHSIFDKYFKHEEFCLNIRDCVSLNVCGSF
jgi:hypothetical protein